VGYSIQNETGRLCVPDPVAAARLLPEMFRGSLMIEMLVGRRTSVTDEEIDTQVGGAVDLFVGGTLPRS
jgi:hypothetical protein